MGRESRLKKHWRLNRLAKRLEAGEFDEPAHPFTPLPDWAITIWGTAVGGTWLYSIVVVGWYERLVAGMTPFLIAVGALSYFEKWRGRRLSSRIWFGVGAAWVALVAFAPFESLREFFAPLWG